ncbi:DNA recombination protein RmuC [Parvularcula sp. LCG005]|uniref:DNA recombination protein RmuC n=1 Tax=Parvularcula sp. LCG005 TaxID=3078805 RepID=UPI002942BEA5|nr:DNA recombination protein RmuC [Parvularcula sp. LCG005]WOI53647.1 DNA recombination protein RmuC [Parvularcula sp. LCG005]
MILDNLTLALGAAIIGWALTMFFLVSYLQRGAKLRTAQHHLWAERERVAALNGRLERLEETQDALAETRASLSESERQRATLSTRVEERERQLGELRQQLENEFRTMSAKLVRETGDALMREAAQSFEKQHVVARKDAETYSRSVSDLLKPMRETLTRYEEGLRDMRDQQKKAQGELTGQITALAQSAGAVQAEARSLASALKSGPKTRGRWGETTLRNVIEMSGLSAHADFSEQFQVTDDNQARKIPDLVVRLPGERMVAVDSKVSLSDWLDAAGAEDDAVRADAAARHGRSVWTHVQQLAAKDYAGALKKDGAIDFVVMFLPGETFFTAAIEQRPNLFQDAFERGVLIATPTTLIAILKSIAHAWRQQRANESAHEVANMASDLYESLRKTGDYLNDLGKALDKTVSSYNSLIGNVESRVMPRARRFADYEMPGTEKPIDLLTDSDADVRLPSAHKDLLITHKAAS